MCQYNESQEIVQVLQISQVCDSIDNCFMKSDEDRVKLKCTNNCNPPCQNGVCINGLCYCDNGYGGCDCTTPDENECLDQPCDIFATCSNTLGSYYCTCNSGYIGNGLICKDIDECAIADIARTCVENADCCNTPGSYVCSCRDGYIGNGTTLCTNLNECNDVPPPCGPGALCKDLEGSFSCTCSSGLTGNPYDAKHGCREFNTDPCALLNNPCPDGAKCVPGASGAECYCPDGFTGDPNVCCEPLPQLCGENFKQMCGLYSTCIIVNGRRKCVCQEGFTGNPPFCKGIDYCESQRPCGYNAKCTNLLRSFTCACEPGFIGNPYSPPGCFDGRLLTCVDVLCPYGSICKRGKGVQCICPSGYTGNPYREGCIEINKCEISSEKICGKQALCLKSQNSYICTCPPGFSGDPALACYAPSGCESKTCPPNSFCIIKSEIPKCDCVLGYVRNHDTSECLVVDSCKNNHDLCGPNANCRNLPAYFICQCPPGTKGDPYDKQKGCMALDCEDITCPHKSQCRIENGMAGCSCPPTFVGNSMTIGCFKPRSSCPVKCPQNSYCHNHYNNAICLCSPGFYGDPHRIGCIAFTHNYNCSETDCGKNAVCKIERGKPVCVCPENYSGNPHLNCAPLPPKECGPRVCGPSSQCYIENGKPLCSCKNGFTGIPPYCEAIDYCLSNPCTFQAICKNDANSYTCQCPENFLGDPYFPSSGCFNVKDLSCSDIICPYNSICWIDQSVNCICPPGYTGNPFREGCSAINECKTALKPVCGIQAICRMVKGKVLCICPPGYAGDPKVECVAPCDASECPENSFCVNDGCECTEGYEPDETYQYCESVDHCQVEVCAATAKCISFSGGFNCVCPPGTTGDPYTKGCKALNCSKVHCPPTSNCILENDVAKCVCPPGYHGNVLTTGCYKISTCPMSCPPNSYCQQYKDCAICVCKKGFIGDPFRTGCQVSKIPMSCDNPEDCGPNSECHMFGTEKQCSCLPGFSGSPPNCAKIAVLPSGSKCIKVEDEIFCVCIAGFTGDPYSQDGCHVVSDDSCRYNSCPENMLCVKRNNIKDKSSLCICKPGFISSEQGCIEPVICSNASCAHQAKCLIKDQKIHCVCFNGTEGDPYHEGCRESVRCTVSCAQGANCLVDNGNISCVCPDGTDGDAYHKGCRESLICTNESCANGAVCFVKDEKVNCVCPNGTEGDPYHEECKEPTICPSNSCAQGAICFVKNHNINCVCPEGTEGDPYHDGCKDEEVDSCSSIRNPCPPFTKCVQHLNGTIGCICSDDKEIEPGEQCCINIICEPEFDCGDKNAICEIHCHEAICKCPPGMAGEPPNTKCQLKCHNTSCALGAICKEENHTNTSCSCPPGTTGDPYEQGCQEYPDACELKKCGESAVCIIRDNQSECRCPEGSTGDPEKKCNLIDGICHLRKCPVKSTCRVIDGISQCWCDNGIVLQNDSDSCEQQNTCGLKNCGENAICIIRDDRGECRCPEGTIGDPDEKCIEADACSLKKCGENAICIIRGSGGECRCPERTIGNPEKNCTNIIDLCHLRKCPEKSTCKIINDIAQCFCPIGIALQNDNDSCEQTQFIKQTSMILQPIPPDRPFITASVDEMEATSETSITLKLTPNMMLSTSAFTDKPLLLSKRTEFYTETSPALGLTSPKIPSTISSESLNILKSTSHGMPSTSFSTEKTDFTETSSTHMTYSHATTTPLPTEKTIFTIEASSTLKMTLHARFSPESSEKSELASKISLKPTPFAIPLTVSSTKQTEFTIESSHTLEITPRAMPSVPSSTAMWHLTSPVNLSNCESVHCPHPSICQSFGNFPLCVCPPGFFGEPFRLGCHPEAPDFSCKCGPNAVCHPTDGKIICVCLPGFTGSPTSSYGCIRLPTPCLTDNPCIPPSKCKTHVPSGQIACVCPYTMVPTRNGCIHMPPYGISTVPSYTTRIHNILTTFPPYKECDRRDHLVCGPNTICFKKYGHIICECLPDFVGKPPDKPCSIITTCSTLDCGPGNPCQEIEGSAFCHCQNGRQWNPVTLCEHQIPLDKSSCTNFPCGLNARCIVKTNQAHCICPGGFTGNPKEECFIISCKMMHCGVEAECKEVKGKAICDCKAGLIGDPQQECKVPEKSCYKVVCGTNAFCNAGKCQCTFGFYGNPTISCGKNPNPCFNFECHGVLVCAVIRGQPTCVCPPDMIGSSYTGCFKDRCSVNSCVPGTICINSGTSFSCICPNGMLVPLNGKCSESSSVPSCGLNAFFMNGKCHCQLGFWGNPNVYCSPPPQYCMPNEHAFCGPNSQCVINDIEIKCSCLSGFQGHPPDSPCIGKNECSLKQREYCGPNSKCVVDAEQFVACYCFDGYIGNPPQTSCKSIPSLCIQKECCVGSMCVTRDNISECICPNGSSAVSDFSCKPNCSQVICPPGTTCQIKNDSLGCFCPNGEMPNPDVGCGTTNCSKVRCPKGTSCEIHHGLATCLCPNGKMPEHNIGCVSPACLNIKCDINENCVEKDGQAVCVSICNKNQVLNADGKCEAVSFSFNCHSLHCGKFAKCENKSSYIFCTCPLVFTITKQEKECTNEECTIFDCDKTKKCEVVNGKTKCKRCEDGSHVNKDNECVPGSCRILSCPAPLSCHMQNVYAICVCPSDLMTFDSESLTCKCPENMTYYPQTTECKCPKDMTYYQSINQCKCLDNMTYYTDTNDCKCQRNMTLYPDTNECKCLGNMTYYPDTNECKCSKNMIFYPDTNECKCPKDMIFYPDTNECKCPNNLIFYSDTNDCKCPKEKSLYPDTNECKYPENVTYYPDINECKCPNNTTLYTETNECKCPENMTYYQDTNECICPNNMTCYPNTNECKCPKDMVYDNEMKECKCPNGMLFKPESKECACLSDFLFYVEATKECKCLNNMIYDFQTNICNCPKDMLLDVETKMCICPKYMTYDSQTKLCTCNNGMVFDNTTKGCKCSKDLVLDNNTEECKCPGNMIYDSKSFECKCPNEVMIYINNKCSCPENMIYDFNTKKCICLYSMMVYIINECRCPENMSFDVISKTCNPINDCIAFNPCDKTAKCVVIDKTHCFCDSKEVAYYEPCTSPELTVCENYNNPCDSSAECLVRDNKVSCICSDGNIVPPNTPCEKLVAICENIVCGKNAVCEQNHCACISGTTGDPLVECEPLPPCPKYEILRIIDNNEICECIEGYIRERNGHCSPLKCTPYSCPHNTLCSVEEGKIVCFCKAGFVGNPPETQCKSLCETTHCNKHEVCDITSNEPLCHCEDGYRFSVPGEECLLVECSKDDCGETGICSRFQDMFKCLCKPPCKGEWPQCCGNQFWNISVECENDKIITKISNQAPFTGVVYVKNHSRDSGCFRVVNIASRQIVDFAVNIGQCGIVYSNEEAHYTLVIQNHPKLVTHNAVAFLIRCNYNDQDVINLKYSYNISMATSRATIGNSGPSPEHSIKILTKEGREVSKAVLGEELVLRIDVTPKTIYGAKATNCSARTLDGSYSFKVTDENGCSTDRSLFSEWTYRPDYGYLTATFYAFKFSGTKGLNFNCNIAVCYGSCLAARCGSDMQQSYGKKRKRRNDLSPLIKKGELIGSWSLSSHTLSVHPNNPLSNKSSDQQIQNKYCIPLIWFILALVLTSLLAMVCVSIAISCWLIAYNRKPDLKHLHSVAYSNYSFSLEPSNVSHQPEHF